MMIQVSQDIDVPEPTITPVMTIVKELTTELKGANAYVTEVEQEYDQQVQCLSEVSQELGFAIRRRDQLEAALYYIRQTSENHQVSENHHETE